MGEEPLPQELIDKLLTLGLEPKEARVYARLTLDGPQRASSLAARAKLNRTETYRALEVLIDRGYVTAQLSRPTVYEAVPPEAAFAAALRRHDGQRESLQRASTAVIEDLAALRASQAPVEQRHAYRMVQGRRAIATLAESMMRNAKGDLRLAATADALLGPSRLLAAARERATPTSPAQVLLQPRVDAAAVRDLLTDARIAVRAFETPAPIRFAIVDDREVLVWLHTDADPSASARGDVAMWTNALEFVRAQRVLFDAVWTRGEDLSPRAIA